MKLPLLTLLLIALAACASGPKSLDNYLIRKKIAPPSQDAFEICRGYGCKFVDPVNLTKKEWKNIDKIFKPKSKSAKQERARIAKAVGLFETYVGAHTGTHEDIAGTFEKTGFYQQDCVDESTNTSIYLKVLELRGALKFHTIGGPVVRLPFTTGRWPHQSAAITDTKTSEIYAVDSWFHENGAPPEIIPLTEWKQGWKPPPKTDTID